METLAALLAPSYAVYRHWVPQDYLSMTRSVFERADLLGVFICVVIVGSLINLPRRDLIAGILKIWVPLVAASIAAFLVGIAVASLAGMSVRDTGLYTLVPAMAGGLTGGALPLAVAYASSFGSSSGDELARILPPVVLANLLSILLAGIWAQRAAPRTSEGDRAVPGPTMAPVARPFGWLAALALMAVMYSCGALGGRALHYPAPLIILIMTGAVQLFWPLPGWLVAATSSVYRRCIRLFTYPLLLAVGLLLVPWPGFVQGLRGMQLVVLLAAVLTLMMVGAAIGRTVGLGASDSALVAVTRAAMGGSGDVAVLVAARRMDLMPFAQISTRIGGALTVALTLLAISAAH